MSFLPNKPRREITEHRKAVGVTVLTFSIIGILFFSTPVGSFAQGVLMKLFSPLARGSVGLAHAFEKKEDTLDVSLAELRKLRAENASLRSMLAVSDQKKETKTARVLSVPPASPYDTILISGGIDTGFVNGALVLGEGRVVLGKIDKVFSKHSRVILYSASPIEVQVIVGQSFVPAHAVGKGSQNFVISLPRGVAVQKGDPVVLRSFGSDLLAIIVEIDAPETETFQTIRARSPVNILESPYVFVEMN